jgi:hypothetical protein
MAVIIIPVFRKGNCLTKSTQLFKGKAWSQIQPSQFLAQCHCYLVMLPSFLYCCQCSASCSGERVILGKVHVSLWHLPHVGTLVSVSWNPVSAWEPAHCTLPGIWFAQSSKLEGLLFYCSQKGKLISVDGVLKLNHHKSDSL